MFKITAKHTAALQAYIYGQAVADHTRKGKALALFTSLGAIDSRGQYAPPADFPSMRALAVAACRTEGITYTGHEGRSVPAATMAAMPEGERAFWQDVQSVQKSLTAARIDAGYAPARRTVDPLKVAERAAKAAAKAAAVKAAADAAAAASAAAAGTSAPEVPSGAPEVPAAPVVTIVAEPVWSASEATPDAVAEALRLLASSGYASTVLLAACREYVRATGPKRAAKAAA